MMRCVLTLAVALAAASPAAAQGVTGDWGGARTRLADSGVRVRGDVTVFEQRLLAGDGTGSWEPSGRYDVFADLDFGKMGLVNGLGFHVHGEGRFGRSRSNFGGQLWPANTGAAIPLFDPDFAASALYFTQAIGARTLVMLGKINAFDLLAADPVLGGLGTQRFMNFVFVGPPSGVTPASLMGGISIHKSQPVSLTVMVYDPEDRTREQFPRDLFHTGVNVSVGGTWSGTIASRASSIGLTAAAF